MEKLFKEVNSLDKRCYEKFDLTEEILMEQAGSGIVRYIKDNFSKGSSVTVVTGGGNNGADGVVIARQLHIDYDVKLYISTSFKHQIGKRQLKRAISIGVKVTNQIESSDILIDSLFGTGLSRKLEDKDSKLIESMNSISAFKIAVDIPSGIDVNGNLSCAVFKADKTFTMGALKLSLFSDSVKDYTGEIEVVDLGVAREIYEIDTDYYKLTESDLELPYRKLQNSHKGSYGHTAILSGEREGASIISALSALNFGSGLVSIVSKERKEIPFELMQDRTIPKNTKVIVAGMGLGNTGLDFFKEIALNSRVPLVVDADIFHSTLIGDILETRSDEVVLTPHPREFQSMLSILFKMDLSTKEIASTRVELLEMFSNRYPNSVILLKGANRVIAHRGKIYIDPLGSPNLAKGGSGDVLAGMIGSLIAQGYSPLQATISGTVAHSIASQNFSGNSYTLTPKKLIEELGKL